jgi:hypothetical protein
MPKLREKTRGQKIRETKKLVKEAQSKIEKADLVSEKYCTKSVGLVVDGPYAKTEKLWDFKSKTYISKTNVYYRICWMRHPKLPPDQLNVPMVYRFRDIKKINEKKVLES